MRVPLGRGHIAVAKEFLHDAQIGSAIEQVGREGVSQRVRVRRRGASFVDYAPNVASADPSASPIQKDRRPRPLPDDFLANRDPGPHRLDRRLRHRNPTFLASLAPHRDDSATQIDSVEIEVAEFAHAKAASVQDFEHGVVAVPAPRWRAFVDLIGFEKSLKFVTIEDARQSTLASGGTKSE
jgi:hypothetical protein